MGVVMVPIDINYLVVVGGDLCSSFPLYCLYHVLPCSNALGNDYSLCMSYRVGHTVWSADCECNTDTGICYYCGNWLYHNHIHLFVEDHGHSFYLCMSSIDCPESRVCNGYCIDCSYSDMYLSEICNSEIGVNYTEVSGLCFTV